jgi:GMP synthase (glutamine-hydrolysing)
MLARAAGAGVGPAPAPEIGWLDVELTEEGRDDAVLGVLPPRTEAFQWHHYTFELPAGAVELARSEICTQAFRAGSHAWGLQFHAEVTVAMVRTWLAEEVDDLPVPAEEFLAATEARIADWNEQGRKLCGAFLEVAASA